MHLLECMCNIDTHNCQANPGSTLLMKIVFTSAGCEGCTKEGVNMTLVGTPLQIPEPRCKTVDLDHPNDVDYASKSTFVANGAEQNLGWENCWQVRLKNLLFSSFHISYLQGTFGWLCSRVHSRLDWRRNLESKEYLL